MDGRGWARAAAVTLAATAVLGTILSGSRGGLLALAVGLALLAALAARWAWRAALPLLAALVAAVAVAALLVAPRPTLARSRGGAR